MWPFKTNSLAKDEVDFVVVQLANLVRVKGVVLPHELAQLTESLKVEET